MTLLAPYAHTAEDAAGNRLPENRWQPLVAHLLAVAKLAEEYATDLDLADATVRQDARYIALLHDLGKYRAAFQHYLRAHHAEKTAETQHAIYGAAQAFTDAQCAAAFVIAGHHAGLHNLDTLQTNTAKAAAKEDIASLIALLNTDLANTPAPVPATTAPAPAVPRPPVPPASGVPSPASSLSPASAAPAHITRAAETAKTSETAAILATEFYTRILFSCLIDADRYDSAFWNAPAPPPAPPKLDPAHLLKLVIAECARKQAANPESPLGAKRKEIFDACLSTGELPQGFFSLTVPTGGGKTLSAMAFALAHAQKHNLRRVIIVIPYLSIIEQNAAEYRRILDPQNKNIVLENHSSVRPRDDANEEEKNQLELLSENWDAPIVITTSVQFVESLFTASPSRARKLHNIARSVVIFDEVQTLPTHLLAPMFSIFRELATNYGVSFVFSSATQPAFRHSASLPDGFENNELHEIAPAPIELFKQLRRVNYHFHNEPLKWETLAEKLAATDAPQSLCVLNLTRHAKELWELLDKKLSQSRPIHLSSAMCPAHRLALIRRIRQRLKAGKPCRVISTQLIEAGVDVDFPVVWRAMGPLDSIAQVAGRCNREGRHSSGDVHVFIPEENKLPPGIYKTATDQAKITLDLLGEDAAEKLATDPTVFGDYFNMLFGVVPTDHAKRGENTIQQERENLHFRKVAEKAKVIEDNGDPVIIPIGKARHLIAAIRAREPAAGEKRFTRDDLRRLQRYMVNVRTHDFGLLKARNLIRQLLPNLEIYVLNEGLYNPHLGLLRDANPLTDFII